MTTNKNNQKNADTDDTDWVKEQIKKAKPPKLEEYEKDFAKCLFDLAFQNSKSDPSLLGHSLAAAFDLLVAAEYYKTTTSKGWLYCSNDPPLIIYPFTNTCTHCVLDGKFHFHKANKPKSGSIGSITRKLLGFFLTYLFERRRLDFEVLLGTEPIDIIVLDKKNDIVLLAEVKAAPLTTLALAVQSSPQNDEGEVVVHCPKNNLDVEKSEFCLLLPELEQSKWKPKLVSLGVKNKQPMEEWVYSQLSHVFREDQHLFGRYFQFWQKAFGEYSRDTSIRGSVPEPVYWLTNACGSPSPRPEKWPKRGKGFESVSDSKSSVGMDRTDDIKKGIYQALKLGVLGKQKSSSWIVKTALLSNIHAVRHYDEYLKDIQDIVWTKTSSTNPISKANELPQEQKMYNLLDGIISFTQNGTTDN